MHRSICRACGTQFVETSAPPAQCPICEDDRQFVPTEGQTWTTLEELRRSYKLIWREEAQGVSSLVISPDFAIGQRAFLIEAEVGNVLWDCISLIDEDAITHIKAKGGLKAIAISHPHFYATMVEWSDAFSGTSIYLHADDHAWIQRPHPAIVLWTGESLSLGPSLTLVRCGGHFAGSSVLHWAKASAGHGAIFTGDTMQVVADRRHVSFMYSYPNLVPLGAAAVERIRNAIAPYDFDTVFGAFPGRTIERGAREAVKWSVERFLAAIRA